VAGLPASPATFTESEAEPEGAAAEQRSALAVGDGVELAEHPVRAAATTATAARVVRERIRTQHLAIHSVGEHSI